jgi:hypothetical protein
MYTEADAPNTMLNRVASGMPYYNLKATEDFLVRVPCSLINDPRPGRVLHYGHGLLGSLEEAGYESWLASLADEMGWVVVAHTWGGMSSDDIPAITIMMVNDVSGFPIIPERSFQGYLTALGLARLATGDLVSDANLMFPGADGDLVSVIDPDRISYYGNSQGGIMGGAYVAMSPDISRGVLGVPGMPYPLLLTRSTDFTPFFLLFDAKYTDSRDISLLIGALGMLWEPAEASGWASSMTNPQEGIGPKQVLIMDAIGDGQVTTLGAQVMARAYGAATVAPQTRPIWGVEESAPGFVGNAIVEWSYSDVSDPPVENTPPQGVDPHECPRRQHLGMSQIGDFLEQGVVHQYCDGICQDVANTVCGAE